MALVLGLSAFYHDSAAALIENDKIIAAAQEERFTRIKHDSSFPFNAIEYVLGERKINISNVDFIVFYEKPFLKFERILETHIDFAPFGFKSFSASMPIWLREKLFQKKLIIDNLKKIKKNIDYKKKIKFSEHHFSHAASAFFASPFKEALILIIDGVGEWSTTSIGIGKNNKIEIIEEVNFPHSLGLLYSAFTYYLGFKVNSGEYKVMGLAPYGIPKYSDIILDNLIDLKNDGSFRLNMKYFDFATGLKMTNEKFNKLFGKKNRTSENVINQFHMDIAASIQLVTEEIILKICRYIKQKYKIDFLCLAGGVALNCVANGKILQNKIFKEIWIQPAAGDAGGALGAALGYYFNELGKKRYIFKDMMQGGYLGPVFENKEIEETLKKNKLKFKFHENNELIEIVADQLNKKMSVGWFQGRMEYGPRALGCRSILANPKSEEMQKELNLKIKFREGFRPFAPSVLYEKSKEYFKLDYQSPYMLLVAQINEDKKYNISNEEKNLRGFGRLKIKRSSIPAVTHVDFSARVQTVNKETNPLYHNLIQKFGELSQCYVLVNTSFNVRGEPIVCSPDDAINCFMGTNLDLLAIGNYILFKDDQEVEMNLQYKNQYELD
tara:strand:+ start:688 stop:2520 length:1833 start_codon:yes stop_codon:yes gene_type:complete